MAVWFFTESEMEAEREKRRGLEQFLERLGAKETEPGTWEFKNTTAEVLDEMLSRAERILVNVLGWQRPQGERSDWEPPIGEGRRYESAVQALTAAGWTWSDVDQVSRWTPPASPVDGFDHKAGFEQAEPVDADVYEVARIAAQIGPQRFYNIMTDKYEATDESYAVYKARKYLAEARRQVKENG